MSSKNTTVDTLREGFDVEPIQADGAVAEVKQPRMFDEATMTVMSSWADIPDGVAVMDASDLGTGFGLVDNKDVLMNIPFAIVGWSFRTGDHGEYVSIELITKDGRKLVLNDGSTGICDQMRGITRKLNDGRAVVMVHKGLTRSEYQYVDGKGQKKDAKTYYLSTSK